MRTVLIAGLSIGLGLAAWAQTPPKNAVDITNTPATADGSAAPSAAVSMPPNVVRVYIGTLSGPDAAAVQGLLTQALFESKKVVVTENQSNASLILQGRILRQQPPEAASSKATTRRRSPARRSNTLPDSTDPTVVQDLSGMKITNLDGVGPAGAPASLDGSAGLNSLAALPLSLGTDSITDLSHYQFRLDLQLVNPEGDLVWMSGQGEQAPPFARASTAVSTCVQPMLSTIVSLTAAAKPTQP